MMIERVPAEIRWHRQEIDRVKQRWFDGEITLRQKRQMIAELNLFFYGDRTPAITRRHLTIVTEETVPTSPPYTEDEEEEPWYKRM